ncbi:MAG: 2-C-methyl-D-erythritol 4-phosphate cytidylyltransferase [Rhodospirillaceae bacterium]|nr:2-C-methyl-D-erythritol 4-phosphate cytidylyltransferase [Rhodospirillaceae bacterium]
MAGCYALIVAGGSGQRFGGELPKQYAPLGTGTVLQASVRAFLEHPEIDGVRCVISQNHMDFYQQSISGFAEGSLLSPVFGGKTRQQSVLGGLESLAETNPDKVLIHDAARPFVSGELISDVIFALDKSTGAIPALAVVDTLKKCTDESIDKTVPRGNLFRAQTPQGFRFKEIISAHRELMRDPAKETVTDDASVLEQSDLASLAGLTVATVAGREENFKITTPDDYKRAQRYLSELGGERETRTGFGYDVHRLGDEGGDKSSDKNGVRLCGIDVPFNRYLLGHSDADVGLHALTDAILGAIGEGDIGEHFPPSDPRLKGLDSEVFVARALELASEKNAKINNVDITIVCEAPKIGPYRTEMRTRIAGILGLDKNRVSVKATTTEGLGATGRGEGVAVQAIATLSFPV